MRRKVVFSVILAGVSIANIIPLFLFREHAGVSVYSFPALMLMILVAINGMFSYFFRHKRNYLIFGKSRGGVFSREKEETYTKNYKDEFFWMFLVYCSAIPFYLPCIFFVSEWIHTLWTLGVLSIPQLCFFVSEILKTLKEVKNNRIEKRKRDQELKMQQQREEMGYFK